MLTEYRRTLGDGRQEDGLVLLSAADGQVLWLAPTTEPYPASAGLVVTARDDPRNLRGYAVSA